MPYTAAQCRKFAVMAARGERVPDDWKHHCKKENQKKKKPEKKRESSR